MLDVAAEDGIVVLDVAGRDLNGWGAPISGSALPYQPCAPIAPCPAPLSQMLNWVCRVAVPNSFGPVTTRASMLVP